MLRRLWNPTGCSARHPSGVWVLDRAGRAVTIRLDPRDPVSRQPARIGRWRPGRLIYTGLLTAGGGFEDRLYARSATDAGQLHGRPAVATVTTGGNGVVAWEVAPGTIAYLGYSGAEFGPQTVDVLRQLASRARALCGRHWRASSPQRTDFGYRAAGHCGSAGGPDLR